MARKNKAEHLEYMHHWYLTVKELRLPPYEAHLQRERERQRRKRSDPAHQAERLAREREQRRRRKLEEPGYRDRYREYSRAWRRRKHGNT